MQYNDARQRQRNDEVDDGWTYRMRALLNYSIRRRNQQNAADGILELLPFKKKYISLAITLMIQTNNERACEKSFEYVQEVTRNVSWKVLKSP